MTERELIERAQRGDLDAFSAITVGRTTRLFTMARLILRDVPLAEDVVQDVLVRAWQDLRGLRDPDRFDAWLQRVLVRACYRAAKRQRARKRTEVSVLEAIDQPTSDPHARVATHDQLERAFAALTTDQRAVVVLHHYLGLSLSESAQVLGIPLGTMQSRLFRALRAMREAISDDPRAGLAGGDAR